MLIEIHILKNYPPVNLNRDENGAPKSCLFGGVMRGRISSQCLKRSWRTSDLFRSVGSVGVRTMKLPELVYNELINLGVEESFAAAAKKKLTGIGNKDGKTNDDGKTNQIAFYSKEEISRVATAIKDIIDQDGDIKTFEKRNPAKDFKPLVENAKLAPISADIALFGRMVTSDYFLNVDASMQVAHAISTHAINQESDFYVAMDDLLKSDEEAGADMLGDIDYNSCCYYEYASIDIDALLQNLRNSPDKEALVKAVVPALLKAMAFTNPSGKQNTFAGQTLPAMVMVECKEDKIPLSYANAFEEPVPTWGKNPKIVETSIHRLASYVDSMDKAYGLETKMRAWFAPACPAAHPEKAAIFDNYNKLIEAISSIM